VDYNVFDNLPLSQSVPNTYTTKVPKKLQYVSFTLVDSDLMTSTNFKSLFTKIDKPLKQVKASGNDCLVLIDNLNILMNGCYNRNELEFVEVLNELIAISENPKVKVALGVNRDLFDEGEIEWYRDFKNSAFDQIFEVSRNLSGYSKDVHG